MYSLSNISESSSHDQPKSSSHDQPKSSSQDQPKTSKKDHPLSSIMSDKVREYLQEQKKLHEEWKAAKAQGAQPPEQQPTISQEDIEGFK